MRRRQKPIIRPASHDVAEIDQKRPRDDRRSEPFAGGQPHGEPGNIGPRQRGHKAVVGVRRLAKGVVLCRLLRRIVQKADDGMGFVGKERRKEIAGQPECRGKRRQHAVAHRAERVEICHHVGADAGKSRRPLVAAAQRFTGDDVRVLRPAVVADKKAFVLVGFCRLVDRRGALHRRIDRQVADIVFVQLHRELLLERQSVELDRGGKSPIDQFIRHAMVQGIKEADLFTGVRDLCGDMFKCSRRAGEVGTIIDYRDLTGGRSMIADPVPLEKMHPVSPNRAMRKYRRCAPGRATRHGDRRRLAAPPGEDRRHHKIPNRADYGSGRAGQPPRMVGGERIRGDADIRDRTDPTDQIENDEAAQQPQPAQPLVAVGELIIQDEIRSHRDHRGNRLRRAEPYPCQIESDP